MAEPEKSKDLAPSSVDYVVTAVEASLGIVPFAGSLLAEIAGTLIPNQRIDRLTKFATALEEKFTKIEQDFIRSQLSNENFIDLVEEGLRQAARSLTDERREYIASLITNSLSSNDIEYLESKHLLRLLGEINDVEVIWLRFYLNPTNTGDQEFREKHKDVLSPIGAHMGSEQRELDKDTIQESYREHLLRLDLLAPSYRIDRKTGFPEFDAYSGRMKVQSYALTRLGRLLLRYLDLTTEDETC